MTRQARKNTNLVENLKEINWWFDTLRQKRQNYLCCYHVQISLSISQQTQSDIFHTKMLQNALWCQITWSKCMLCNIYTILLCCPCYMPKYVPRLEGIMHEPKRGVHYAFQTWDIFRHITWTTQYYCYYSSECLQ